MNYTVLKPSSIKKTFAVLLMSALLTALIPVGIMTASAETTGITVSPMSVSTTTNSRVNFVVSTTYNSSTTPGTYITVSDNGGGGSFYDGTVGGACNNPTPDGDNEFSINQNKGVCYSNAVANTYTLTVRLFDSADNQIGSPVDVTANITNSAPTPPGVLTAEEFVTVNGSYKGISVGFRTENFGTATAVTVVMERADGSFVTKTANQGVLDIINLDTPGGDQLTAPFVIEEGTFTEASDTDYWDPAPATWSTSTKPVEVTITVTDQNGDVSVVNSTFNEGAPSWPTYESLLPPPPYAYPSTNEMNKNGTNPYQSGVGPHVYVVDDSVPGEITLAFVNPKSYIVCFEYRTDGDTSQEVGTANPNPEVDDRYPHLCVTQATTTQTFEANDYIEVRSTFGAERDWDFDWTLFDVITPAPKTVSLVEVTGNTAAGENQEGWLFNRDVNTATPFEFNNDQSSIGDGALYVLPIGTTTPSDKFIAEYFALEQMGNIDSFSYDFQIGPNATTSYANEFYLNVYANFGVSSSTKFYDCRYNVVPTTGVVGGWTTVTFDPSSTYSVTTRTGGEASPFACPSSPAAMGADAVVRVFAINLGDSTLNDAGVDGYFDNVVFETDTEITTFDFEMEEVDNSDDDDRSSSSGGRSGGGPTPQVLGASTDAEMLALLNAIEARLYELLAERNATTPTPVVGGTSTTVPTTPSVVVEEEEVEEDETNTSTPDVVNEEDEEEMEEVAADIPWSSLAWLLVALWLIASGLAYWHKSRNPGSVAMRMVQGAFGTIGVLLLIAFFLFNLAGAIFWPILIVAVGATTAYFWTLD